MEFWIFFYLLTQQTTLSYTTELMHLIEKSSHQVVILVDSIDKAIDINDIEWLPLELVNNVKIVLTVTEDEASQVFKALKSKIKPENFLQLPAFTREQWEDVLTYGGGANNGALQLPEDWKKSDERAPIQAKVIWFCLSCFSLTTYSSSWIVCCNLIRFSGGWHGSVSENWRISEFHILPRRSLTFLRRNLVRRVSNIW